MWFLVGSPGSLEGEDGMRFLLASVLGAVLLSGCGDSSSHNGAAGSGGAAGGGGSSGDRDAEGKCLNGPDCCFSDDDCGEGEYCEGEGACDSEGACELILLHPCGLAFDAETGEPTMPVCGCDGVTYQGACMATTSGHRIAYDGVCEAGALGNTLIRVDTLSPGSELARMDIGISCDLDAEPPGQAPPDAVHTSGELELTTGEGGESFWEGVFDLPIGACTLTLRVSCDGEVVCVGSVTSTILEGENILDVILPCSTGAAVCDGMGQP